MPCNTDRASSLCPFKYDYAMLDKFENTSCPPGDHIEICSSKWTILNRCYLDTCSTFGIRILIVREPCKRQIFLGNEYRKFKTLITRNKIETIACIPLSPQESRGCLIKFLHLDPAILANSYTRHFRQMKLVYCRSEKRMLHFIKGLHINPFCFLV